jgi:hypothetical protein
VRKAFLSSTGADLSEYRQKVYEAIQALDDWKCLRMEDFGARDWEVESFCLQRVRECDLSRTPSLMIRSGSIPCPRSSNAGRKKTPSSIARCAAPA